MGLAYGVGYQAVTVPGTTAQPSDAATAQPTQVGGTVVVDGTPVRVVAICLAAAAGLTALRWGGLRFNVGVGG